MKLNKTNREEIIHVATTAAFKTREAAHAKARTALADALCQHTHGEAEKIAKKLPQTWQAGRDCFDIACDGFRTWGSKDGAPRKLSLSRSRLFPPHYSAIEVDRLHALYADAQAIVKEHHAIESAKEELRTKLYALVHSVTSTEKLRELWPEGAKFLPSEAAKMPRNLPVPHDLVASVNALMDVKSKAQAAR